MVSTTAIALLVIGLVIGGAVGYSATLFAAPATSSSKTYTLGVIQPLSGQYAEYGKSFLNAATLAVNQMNANLSAAGNPIQFKLVHADDAGTASGANTALQTMYSSYGVHVIIGPLTSGEVQGVLGTADTDHIVVLPPAATATSLEYPRSSTNYLMRPGQPGDQYEGSALGQAIIQLHAKNVVYIYRDDTSEAGTYNISSTLMISSGLNVMGIPYTPGQTDYAAQVQTAESDVQQFLSSGGSTSNTVVALGGGGQEAQNIFTHAQSDTGLSSVRWFGIESLDDPTLLSSSIGPFMAKVNLTIMSPASFTSPQENYFNSTFIAAYGSAPLPYSNYAYDNTWIAMLSILIAGSNSGPAILSSVPIAADHYFGATGTGVWLDQNNDQTFAYYNILKVVPATSSTSTVVQIGTYNGATNQVSLSSS